MEIAEKLIDIMQFNEEEAWLLKKIYKNSSVQKRYSVHPDILHPKNAHFSAKELNFIGMSERNDIYKKEAPLLAEKAAREAINNWKGDLNQITHVISVSCTGIMTPGIEFILARSLGLEPQVSLLGINFMGCFGAIKALKVASKIAKENPKNRILLVSTELCSLHFKTLTDIETTVIQSLFADGSAAVVIGAEPQENETHLFEFIDEHCSYIKDSTEDMTWDASTEGFDMTLSPRVPKLIGENIESFVKNFLGAAYDSQEYIWAIHPGGKAIVEAVEEKLNLDRSLTASSWNVLQSYGNISSATFLYVLDDICQSRSPKEKTIGIGFGPGLCIEALLLKKTAC
jgi:predicted naringenin-chalcone synthase